jgi:hypothetical protein
MIPSSSKELVKLPRPKGGASRKGNLIHIVPLNPAYKAGLAGHAPVNTFIGIALLKP